MKKRNDDFRYHVFDCDLLIIDDLGTEMVNAFVSSQLFLLINERLMRKKSTVISTNLTPGKFSQHVLGADLFPDLQQLPDPQAVRG